MAVGRNETATAYARDIQRGSAEVWALLLLGCAWVAVVHRQILLAQTIAVGDTVWVFSPLRALGAVCLRAGEIGLWNPHVFGGLPFAADPQSQVFYPFHLLLSLLPVPAAMSLTLALHYLMALVGSYLLARYTLRVGPWPAAVMGLAFGLCGPALTRSLVPCYPEALAWMPWALLASEWYVRRGGAARLLAPVGVITLQFLTGAPQYTYYTVIAMLGMAAYRVIHGQSRAERVRAAVCVPGTAVGALLLAMVQLLPMAEMARLTDRVVNSGYAFATTFSLPVKQFLATLLFPSMYGSAESPELEGFAIMEYSGYVGIATLSLALVAVVASPRRRLVWWLVVAAGLSVFLAAGAHNPLYPVLFRFVPGLSLFRCPARFILITDLALATLAALGLATPDAGMARKRGLAVTVALVPLGVAVALVPSASGRANAWLCSAYPFWPLEQLGLVAVSCVAVVVLCVAGTAGRRRLAGVGAVACAGLLAIDLVMFSQSTDVASTVPNQVFAEVPATVQAERAAGAIGRHWSTTAGAPLRRYLAAGAIPKLDPLAFRVSAVRAMLALLPSDLPAAYQVDGLTGAWGAMLPLARHVPSLYLGQSGPVQRQWLSLLNVRYYACEEGTPPAAGLKLVAVDDTGVTLWEDPTAGPRAFLAARGEPVRSAAEAIARIEATREFLLSKTVYVEGWDQRADTRTGADLSGAQVVWQTRSPERHVLTVEAPQPCWLVVCDNYFPGWKALVDDQQATVLPANGVMRAVWVPAGRRCVTLYYFCSALCVGGFVTLCTLFALAALVIRQLAGRESASCGGNAAA